MHDWEASMFRHGPCLKCVNCGFIWQPHMKEPKSSCKEIQNAKK